MIKRRMCSIKKRTFKCEEKTFHYIYTLESHKIIIDELTCIDVLEPLLIVDLYSCALP